MKRKATSLFDTPPQKTLAWFLAIGGVILASFLTMGVIWQSVNTMEKIRFKEQELLMDHIAQTARLFIQEGQLDYFYRIITLLTRISFIENLAVYQNGQRILQAGHGEQKRLDEFNGRFQSAKYPENSPTVFRKRHLSDVAAQPTELRAAFSLREVQEPKRSILLSFFVIAALIIAVSLLSAKLQFTLRRLREVERLRGHMVNSISHDASHDLGVIYHKIFGMLEHKKDFFKSAQVEKDLKIVMESVESMVRYLDNLKDQKRLGFGSVDLKPEAVEMTQLIQGVSDSFREKLQIRKMKLSFRKGETVLWAWVTPQIAKRVLMNLLHNAIKYSQPGACIEIQTEARGGDVRVAVKDHGAGIAPEYWEKIFEPYWQIKPESPGIGLGLYISRQLIRMSGGELNIAESTPGAGTTFYFTLPQYGYQTSKVESCRES